MRTICFALVGMMLLGGAGRLSHLQLTRGPDLKERAEDQSKARMSIPAQRGEILDTRGRELAGSVRVASIYAEPRIVGDAALAAASIAPILGLDRAALERTLRDRSERGFAWVKRRVSDEELARFTEIKKSRGLDAFNVQREPIRIYPMERTAAHVLGFVGAEHSGLAGVEQAMDEYLRGRDGSREVVVDARRRDLTSVPLTYEAPVDGASVILTIDANIQQIAEARLAEAAAEWKPEWASAMVMDPRSGEVLAMTSWPTFDPSDPFRGATSDKERDAAQLRVRNRCVSDAFEPGSIFKPFITSLALEERQTTQDEVFEINGPTRQFGARTIHDTHPYQRLSTWEVISKSSNIGMGLLGDRLGNERMHRYVRSYGFGDVSGLGLPGEHEGLVRELAKWGTFSTQSIPMGQELGATPVQLLTAFSALCNDGVLMRPRIIRGVVSSSGETIADWSRPVAVRRLMSPETARAFRLQALAQVVVSGTGKQAASRFHQFFGKTGTAQIQKPGTRGYTDNAYAGSFVGGGPLSEPRAAVIVTIYHPENEKKKYYGGTVAAPTAGKILAATLKYMRVPDEPVMSPTGSTDARD